MSFFCENPVVAFHCFKIKCCIKSNQLFPLSFILISPLQAATSALHKEELPKRQTFKKREKLPTIYKKLIQKLFCTKKNYNKENVPIIYKKLFPTGGWEPEVKKVYFINTQYNWSKNEITKSSPFSSLEPKMAKLGRVSWTPLQSTYLLSRSLSYISDKELFPLWWSWKNIVLKIEDWTLGSKILIWQTCSQISSSNLRIFENVGFCRSACFSWLDLFPNLYWYLKIYW